MLYFSLESPLQNKGFSNLRWGVGFPYLGESGQAIFKNHSFLIGNLIYRALPESLTNFSSIIAANNIHPYHMHFAQEFVRVMFSSIFSNCKSKYLAEKGKEKF